MAFLDEVNSLRAKTGLSKARVPVVIGLVCVVLVVAVAIGVLAWNGFTMPGVSAESDEVVVQADAVSEEEEATESIYVHITGEVQSPGMYELEQGARVQDAIDAAGGFTDEALDTSINLARELTDGEQIVVANENDTTTTSTDSSSTTSSETTSDGSVVNGKININLADSETLQTLNGIGEVLASSIIAYREENGSFGSIEEIQEVSGIGEKRYENIKDYITV